MKEVILPYQFKPREYQIEFFKSNARFKIAVWHRRAGKSKTALNDQITKAISQKGVYYYILPTYKQAKQTIWDALLDEHLPAEIVKKKNDSELAVYYRNGSIQRFVGSEDFDKHRGINPIDVVFDEYSEQASDIWTAIIQPVLRENKGTATFIFTPKGQNHAWQLLQKAKDNPLWWTSVKTVDDTGAIEEAELTEAKKETPQALFNQEYYCEFLENAGAFFRRVKENTWHGISDPEQGEVYQLGVDLAKYQDWTVITPFNLNTFKVLNQDRFNQIDWNLQKARIEASARKYNNAKVIPDSTGVGDPITEDLMRQGLSVEPFKFTEQSKRQLLDNLALLLEQDRIQIPDDEGLISELQSMQYVLGDTGKIKIAVPENMTDDRIMSLALAVKGATWPLNKQSKETTDGFALYEKQTYD